MLTPKQIEEILAKKPEKRYNYFIKTVVETEEVWGLADDTDGWLMLEDDEDDKASDVIAVFPSAEFAQIFAEKGGFSDEFKPEVLDLYEFTEWLEDFEAEGVVVAVFPTPDFQATVLAPERILSDITAEIEKQDGVENEE
jgi:hypothetical protein